MNLEKYRVAVEKLRWRCDPESFEFDCTVELNPLQEFIGQDRAIDAIEFGLGVDKPGYNIFVTGLTGTGKASAVKAHLEKLVAKRAEAEYEVNDWCYVYNFSDPDRPKATKLPRGKGKMFRDRLEALLTRLRTEITKAFSSEKYEARRKEITEESQERHRQLFQELETKAGEEGFALQASPLGIFLIPLIHGKQATQAEFMALKEEERKAIEEKRAGLMRQLEDALQRVQALEKETAEKIRDLDRKIADHTIARPFGESIADFQALPEVTKYLEEIRAYTLNNTALFQQQEAPPAAPPAPQTPLALKEKEPFLPFKVNVFVDNSDTLGPPIIVETNPTYTNLMGKIDRRAMLGAYFTDHTMLKAGALSLANGGYLVLNARDVLSNPGVWPALKRVIKNKELRLEDPLEQFGFAPPQSLRPQPIPTSVKVVMMGDYLLYHLLSLYDEDTWEIFKVKADFDSQIERSPENLRAYACFISSCCQNEGLNHFDRTGVAKVVEHAARLVADQDKLSSRFGQIRDLLIEADYWAKKSGSPVVTGEHVQQALEAKVYRSNLVDERLRELITEGTLMVDVTGAVVGQVNGLEVYVMGDFSFGKPARITAKTFMGRGGVINIERESQLSGRTHNKGVLILSGYLGWKYAQDKPLTLSASLCFEQSYQDIDGDSASTAELYAILSSLSEFPLRQDIAVTGSVNQKGELQPIGGVNQKIEGFFDVCKAKGLTRNQGVLIPYQNIKHLMLREEVGEAVRRGEFHIYSVKTTDEGIELLTGVPAGEKGPDGSYPEGTVNCLVDRRLRQLAEGLRGFQAEKPEAKG